MARGQKLPKASALLDVTMAAKGRGFSTRGVRLVLCRMYNIQCLEVMLALVEVQEEPCFQRWKLKNNNVTLVEV